MLVESVEYTASTYESTLFGKVSWPWTVWLKFNTPSDRGCQSNSVIVATGTAETEEKANFESVLAVKQLVPKLKLASDFWLGTAV